MPDTTVTIIVRGNFATLSPPLAVVEEVLSHRRHQVSFPRGRAAWRRSTILMCDTSPHDQFIPAGSVPRIVSLLESHGYEVHVQDQRRALPEHQPDTRFIAGLGGKELAIAQSVAGTHGGFLRFRNEQEMLLAAGVIARVYHSAQVLAAAATKAQCKLVHVAIGHWTSWSVGRVGSGYWPGLKQVAIATLPKLQTHQYDDWHVVLLPFAESSILTTRIQPCWRARDQLVFALSTSQGEISPRLMLRLEEEAGPVIYDSVPRPLSVSVHFCPAVGAANQCAGTALQRKRALIWVNNARNALIARVAEAVADRDGERLGELQLPDVTWPAPVPLSPSLPVVLVESPEHARELAHLMPGWTVRAAVGQDRGTATLCALPATTRGLIATHLAALSIPLGPNQIVIRADGGPHDLQLAAFDRRSAWAPTMLIDFYDLDGGQLTEDSDSRIAMYRARGWTVLLPTAARL